MIITANELKTKGLTYMDKMVYKHGEVFISIRGKKRFVILDLEEYERLKESDLDNAIKEAEQDYKNGKYIVQTAKEHFKKLKI